MLRLVPEVLATPPILVDDEDTSRVRLRATAPQADPQMRIDAAVAMHMIGQHRQALEILGPLLDRTDRTGGEVLWLVALCHMAEGRNADAATCLEMALLETAVTELGRVALLYELGAVRAAMKDQRRARECFLAVTKRAPWFRDAAARAYELGA
jgi:tetratricopeptide (TPR) repeat protein